MKKYGLPYMGNKSAIAEVLLMQMRKHKPKAKYFYDLFGGGGSMSFMALQFGYKVIYNEYNTGMTNLISYIVERIRNCEKGQYGLFPDEWYEFVDREKFKECLEKNDAYSQFVKIVYSFGNNCKKGYAFGKDIEKNKELAHNIVVFKDLHSLKELNKLLGLNIIISNKNSINERRLEFMRYIKNKIDLNLMLQNIENLTRLQNIENLTRLRNIEITNKSYRDVEIPYNDEEVIIYCDPPYRNTEPYSVDFYYNEFDNWVRNNDKTIFISEYDTPFNEIFSIKKRVLLSATNNSNIKEEKLFTNKNIEKEETLLDFMR